MSPPQSRSARQCVSRSRAQLQKVVALSLCSQSLEPDQRPLADTFDTTQVGDAFCGHWSVVKVLRQNRKITDQGKQRSSPANSQIHVKFAADLKETLMGCQAMSANLMNRVNAMDAQMRNLQASAIPLASMSAESKNA